MAEQFNMEIYNIALSNGSYTPPQDSVSQNNISNGVSAPNLVYMTEGLNRANVDYRQFSDNSDKK